MHAPLPGQSYRALLHALVANQIQRSMACIVLHTAQVEVYVLATTEAIMSVHE